MYSPPGTYLRPVNTSQPRFKRLAYLNAQRHTAVPAERRTVTSTISPTSMPVVHAGNTLDCSKENLLFERQLQKVRSACKLDQTTIVGKFLGTIRKDFDLMAKQTAKELTTLRLRQKETAFLKERNRGTEEQKSQVQQTITEQQTEVAEMREKREQAAMQTKILENIIARMRSDHIHYKQLSRITQEELHKKAKHHKLLEQTIIHEDHKVQKLIDSLNQCKAAYKKNNQGREKKYQDYSGRIGEVKEREEFLEERRDRTFQLQSIELNDTLDEKNIRMRQMCLAHRLADTLLESKVSKLINDYAHLQQAFHLVKAKTAISDPQLLTAKFFSYEQTAQNLLLAISQHQRRMEQLTADKAILAARHQALIDQGLAIDDATDLIKPNQNICSQKEDCIKAINRNKLLSEQILHWVDRSLLLFHNQKVIKSMIFEQKFRELCLTVIQTAKKCDSYDWKIKNQEKHSKKQHKQASEQSVKQGDEEENDPLEYDLIQSSFQSIVKKGFSIKHFKRDSNCPK